MDKLSKEEKRLVLASLRYYRDTVWLDDKDGKLMDDMIRKLSDG